jgi:hypothetical protein
LRIVLQRTGGLRSFRQDAVKLEEWNLAALGEEQSKDSKERLSWVAVDFGTMGEKYDFEKMFKSVRVLYKVEAEEYGTVLRTLSDQAL